MTANLLPSGFYDVLAPEAEAEARAAETVLACLTDYGYARVATPLMEFEETLLSGPGAALNRSTFRVMDPESQRMLGLRTDHTLQIARIAETRMAATARPLRLSYAGAVLRLSGDSQNPARQLRQVGAECIGSLAPEADAEMIRLAAASLERLGITDISVDLLLPPLVPSLAEAYGLDAGTSTKLNHALNHKDEAAVQALAKGAGGKTADVALQFLRASGSKDEAMAVLQKVDLPEKAALDRTRIIRVLELLKQDFAPRITVDLVERRGFEYHSGLSFTFYARARRAELGRGGRYRTGAQEPATGFTFYTGNIMPVLPPAPSRARLLVPSALPTREAASLLAQGYVLVQALSSGDAVEARAQGCMGVLQNGKVQKI